MWFKPLEGGEPGKVLVERGEAAVVLDRHRGDRGIGNQVASRPSAFNELSSDLPMVTLAAHNGGSISDLLQELYRFDGSIDFPDKLWMSEYAKA